ncbi:MAG: MFS transporter, partial [Candidatus Aenigmatarchaeota archaeon]
FPFLVYTASIPLALALWFWFPFLDKSSSTSIISYLKSLGGALKNPRVQAVSLLNFLAFFLLYTVVTFIPQRLTGPQFGMSEALAGVFLGVQAMGTIAVAMQSGKLVEMTEKGYLIGLGFLVSGIGFLVLPLRGVLLWIALSLVVFGMGRGFFQPQINALIAEVAPEGRLGGIVAVNNIAKFAGQMASPLALGIILAFSSFQMVFLTSGLIGIGTGVGAFVIVLLKS